MAPTTHVGLQLLHHWIVLLNGLMGAAASLYADICDRLADDIALVEEHRPNTPTSSRPALTAAKLGRAARALRQARAA